MAYGSFDVCRGNGIRANTQLEKNAVSRRTASQLTEIAKRQFRTKSRMRCQARARRLDTYMIAVWQPSVTTFRHVAQTPDTDRRLLPSYGTSTCKFHTAVCEIDARLKADSFSVAD
eukprot:scaffold156874_cov19-Prasinocladus_malaysianus.AAC.1